jgi:hypothetical protein
MKKTFLLFALALSIICAAIATGCTTNNPRQIVAEPAATCETCLPAPIHEFYEDENGLHVITLERDGAYSEQNDILIELEDEQTRYYFEIDGWNYELEFFRTGNPSDGIQAVFVAFRGQLYSIDSHRLSPSRLAGMRKLIHN